MISSRASMSNTAALDPFPPETVLVTGFPGFAARRFAATIANRSETERLFLLADEKAAPQTREFCATLPNEIDAKVLLGDVRDLDLGLSGDEHRALVSQLTTVHHIAGLENLDVDKQTAHRLNVNGTRRVLDLAAECRRLRRMCHWSSVSVSGKRKGVVMEDELDVGQLFHNVYEETRFLGESLAEEAKAHLPVTILRPGNIIGDSTTGEMHHPSGHHLMEWIVTNALKLNAPMRGRGTAPLHVVPIDFVVAAAHQLSMDSAAAGRTFHIVDPCPLSAKRVFELVSHHADATRRGFIPAGIARTVLRTPGLERLARMPLTFLDSLDRQVFYNCRHTLELLERTDIRCPAFDRYVDQLIRFVKKQSVPPAAPLEESQPNAFP